MRRIRFTVEGVPYELAPGRALPGLPPWHIVRNGAHLSLAYPEAGGETCLFDDYTTGYRLDLTTGKVTTFPRKREYWAARERAGWPARRREAVAP